MALYAIGDLHLFFQSECRAPMQRTERVWKDHAEVFRRNCARILTPEDTLVLVGDHSWGRNLAHCEKDLAYIEALPGRKILVRGNHDMFWDSKKTARLNALYAGRLNFLQGNYYIYGDYALVGTKGYCFEGPFWLDRRGRIVRWDREAEERAGEIVQRELGRLRESFEAARRDGHNRFLMFLHYPPTSILETRSPFTDLAEEYGAHQVIYAHSPGASRFHNSIEGNFRSIEYSLVFRGYFRRGPPEARGFWERWGGGGACGPSGRFFFFVI